MEDSIKLSKSTPLYQNVPSFPRKFLDTPTQQKREHIVAPHVESFNYFVDTGIHAAIADIPPIDIKIDDDLYIRMSYTDVNISYPTRDDSIEGKLTPREARERGLSYAGPMSSTVSITVNNEESPISITTRNGDLPIMVMSSRCHLKGLNAKRLVALKEEASEVGGFFIMNGIERVVRLLQVPRRNYASAIERNSYKNRGPLYSDKGVAMRCVRDDQSSVTVTLHYLTNGGATLRFVLRKQEFLLPVVVVAKALVDITDKELYDRIVQGDTSNTFLTTRIELLIRDAKTSHSHITNTAQARAFLGGLFRIFLPVSDRCSDEEAGALLLSRFVFVHVNAFGSKFDCLLHMLRKLFSFAQGRCVQDNADAFMSHEILQPGHLLNMQVKEKLEDVLVSIKQAMVRDYRLNKEKFKNDIKTTKYFQKNFERFGGSIGPKIGTFLSTGNIVSSTGLDLMQVSGYTVVADRLNMFRYLSHFLGVHRGQFFTTMKTTTVRKLLPESWGFLCPVHTPDGSPCGLLNHLTKEAVILSHPTQISLPLTPAGPLVPYEGSESSNSLSSESKSSGAGVSKSSRRSSVSFRMGGCNWALGQDYKNLLVSLGVVPVGFSAGDGQMISSTDYMPVLLDGEVVGALRNSEASEVVRQLRVLKCTGGQIGKGEGSFRIDPTSELAYVPSSSDPSKIGAFPGLYIFTQPGRAIRPVIHLETKLVEWIGSLEQVYMDIACLPDDIIPGLTTHIEKGPSVMLSQIAAMTPFSDYNQSPRNMYQCQMAKQTMGTPTHLFKERPDNKLYRIMFPQAPITQTSTHKEYCMDEYPQGTNAVVAVISFTGYDMEDAMIINKSSYERGFGHASLYKTVVVDLEDEEKRGISGGAGGGGPSGGRACLSFSNLKPIAGLDASSSGEKYFEDLDLDGLPFEGQMVAMGEPLCCMVDSITNTNRIVKHKDDEPAFIHSVRVFGGSDRSSSSTSSGKSIKRGSVRKVKITLRFKRNPIIGDKFSSRHGQKGTLSVLWPQENMPFSDSGIFPDVLINPHAFPSRMTIGMLIESMAGKAGAMHGHFQDGSPFQFHEQHKAIDYFGEQLRACGYHYYGSEPLYNGMTGNLMHAEIFIGVVYYQRLRHMVSDKFQARSTGPVMAITRQPVKGRKKHGGIRLGEMERDALLSHGVAFCLYDRLMNSSDAHLAHVCSKCGELIGVYSQPAGRKSVAGGREGAKLIAGSRRKLVQVCSQCDSEANVKPVNLPYVYRYLVNELAAMGIRISLKLSE